MSTPPQYDPEKTNAWTRDLPSASESVANLRQMQSQILGSKKNIFGDIANQLEALDAAARAVIAAGKHKADHPAACSCQKCEAWNALAELLKL